MAHVFFLLMIFIPLVLSAEPLHSGHSHTQVEKKYPPQDLSHTHKKMPASFGSYAHSREASGTAWQPESSVMEGVHFTAGEWAMMSHASIYGIYSDQGGKRGDEKVFSNNMAMLMGAQTFEVGTIGFRTMLSLDALMGKRGYPELLQTGETADGEEELVDRQHPHDLFMELALTYSTPVAEGISVFLYGGLPGEPALGPPTFMHRISGMDNPEAPISHHWLDATHITFGVVTAGVVIDDFKLEGSVFNGREPDQDRYDIEVDPLDSRSARLSYNPTINWSLQVSHGYLEAPEQLHPEVNQRRTSLSATYNLPLAGNDFWATTVAFGRNENSPGNNLNAWLLESAYKTDEKHTLFSRAEFVTKDELLEGVDHEHHEKFDVSKIAVGYIYDFPKLYKHLGLGIGAQASIGLLPDELDSSYGEDPISYLLFVRAKLS